MHWQEYDWLWTEKHVTVCKNHILFYCYEIPESYLPGNYKVFVAKNFVEEIWKKYGEKHQSLTHLIGAEGKDTIQILY